jgi:hypothetical protein
MNEPQIISELEEIKKILPGSQNNRMDELIGLLNSII